MLYLLLTLAHCICLPWSAWLAQSEVLSSQFCLSFILPWFRSLSLPSSCLAWYIVLFPSLYLSHSFSDSASLSLFVCLMILSSVLSSDYFCDARSSIPGLVSIKIAKWNGLEDVPGIAIYVCTFIVPYVYVDLQSCYIFQLALFTFFTLWKPWKKQLFMIQWQDKPLVPLTLTEGLLCTDKWVC